VFKRGEASNLAGEVLKGRQSLRKNISLPLKNPPGEGNKRDRVTIIKLIKGTAN
jgi:hypothetical protein